MIDGSERVKLSFKPSGALCIILGCLAWSFAGVLSKWTPWGAYSIIGARSLFTVMVFAAKRRIIKPSFSRGNWIGAFGVAATSALFIIANKMTSAANAIVLQYAMPVVVILGYWIFQGKKPSLLDAGTGLLVLLGVALCFMGGFRRGALLGDALALLSAFTFALVFFAARMEDADTTEYAYLGNLLGSLFLIALPFDPGFTLAPGALISVTLMGVCLSLGYLLFSSGMKAGVHPVTASILANVEPVMNPFWAFVFLGENPGALSLFGAALVLFSVSAYSLFKSRQDRNAALAGEAARKQATEV